MQFMNSSTAAAKRRLKALLAAAEELYLLQSLDIGLVPGIEVACALLQCCPLFFMDVVHLLGVFARVVLFNPTIKVAKCPR
jgi:hypothetical protein